MLLAHVVDLHAGKETKGQCFLDRKTRIVRVNMNFYDIIVRNDYDGVTNGFQICLELMLAVFVVMFFQIDDKLRTIAILNVCGIDISCCCAFCLSLHVHSCLCVRNGDINLFAAEAIKCAL